MPSLIELDMESSFVIELKITCIDIGIFCWTNPCRKKKKKEKLSNKLGGGPEMNSH
jgi:hypothetical protein